MSRPERAGGDGVGVDRLLALAQPHDGALAEGAIDLAERRLEGALLLRILFGHDPKNRLCHLKVSPYFTATAEIPGASALT